MHRSRNKCCPTEAVWTSCHTHVKSWSCTAHDSLNNRRLINSFLASRSLKIHLIVLKVAWTIVFAIVISIVKTHFRFQVCFYDYSVHHNLHGHWHANLSMAFFNFFLYLHTWYTGDYSSFSFLLDTLCLLVLIIDNIKWKVKGDYSSWVSNHKLFYHFPLYSNYRNSYFTYVTVTIVQFMQPFPQTIKSVQTDSTCTRTRGFFSYIGVVLQWDDFQTALKE